MPNGGDGPWPVAVRYSWGGGADLQARTVDSDGKVLRAGTALANAELDHRAWDELPVRDANGNRIEYWIDSPGDDRVAARDLRLAPALARGRRQDAHPIRPHVLAEPRARRARHPVLVLLSLQRVAQPSRGRLGARQRRWCPVLPVLPRSGPRPTTAPSDTSSTFTVAAWRRTGRCSVADHPVVFVGGRARMLWWSGEQSGGSYPWPASYPGVGGGIGPLAVGDDTRGPVRMMPPTASTSSCFPSRRGSTRALTPSCRGSGCRSSRDSRAFSATRRSSIGSAAGSRRGSRRAGPTGIRSAHDRCGQESPSGSRDLPDGISGEHP